MVKWLRLTFAAKDKQCASTQSSQGNCGRFRSGDEVEAGQSRVQIGRRVDAATNVGECEFSGSAGSRDETLVESNRGLSPGWIQAAAVVPNHHFKCGHWRVGRNIIECR